MLESLHLTNVGPAPEMKLELAPRLNLITGDNGLGKSFLLDVAWWALTRKWPHDLNANLTSGYAARPTNVKAPASITLRVRSKSGHGDKLKARRVMLWYQEHGKLGPFVTRFAADHAAAPNPMAVTLGSSGARLVEYAESMF